MNNPQPLIILQQAIELRNNGRTNIEAGRFREDDIQMERYNYIASKAVGLFPDDPVIGHQLVKMPDANLQLFLTPMSPGPVPPDMVSRRLDERLSILIDRLELILGERVDHHGVPMKTASSVLRSESGPDINQALEQLETLS